MQTTFGYLRVSGKGQLDGDGFTRQRLAIDTYAAQSGLVVSRWFEEKATPGKTEWEDRPAWAEMATLIGEGSVILIERLDRLARDLMVQEHIIADLRKRHVILISTAEPDLCVDDPTRKLLRQIMGAIAEYDRTMIVRKMAAARKRMKVATGRCEGRKGYGFRTGESEIVQVMLAKRRMGETWRKIADDLNTAGILTRTAGRIWHPSTVHKILKQEKKREGEKVNDAK